jgi:hypothetical protein
MARGGVDLLWTTSGISEGAECVSSCACRRHIVDQQTMQDLLDIFGEDPTHDEEREREDLDLDEDMDEDEVQEREER